MGTEVNIQVPPGDVTGIEDAAKWHSEIAETLENGRDTLVKTNFSLATKWEGSAAQAYSDYSSEIERRYGEASDQAREIASRLRSWAAALHEDQVRSKGLLREADLTATEIDRLKARVLTETEVVSAKEKSLADLQSQVASSADPVLAQGLVSAATGAVQTAKGVLAASQKRLAGLREELEGLERRAAVIYNDAAELARRHNAYLSSINVTPPALLSAPAKATNVMGQGSSVASYAAPITTAAPAVTALASSSDEGDTAGSDTGAPTGVGAPIEVPHLSPVPSGATQGAISFGDLEKLGAKYGWSKAQDEAWWEIIKLESGGNPLITNPSSGAFGIGQFLGSTLKEYAPYGAASTNPMDQLYAMAKYINDRYGSPQAALTFHLAHNWY